MSNTVRAKFKLDSFHVNSYKRQIDPAKGWADENTEKVEIRTLHFSPVYGNGDPNHENTKFWNASPSGKLELGCINPEAWKHFKIDQEYYLDFIPAEKNS